jgi:hypothetical protein
MPGTGNHDKDWSQGITIYFYTRLWLLHCHILYDYRHCWDYNVYIRVYHRSWFSVMTCRVCDFQWFPFWSRTWKKSPMTLVSQTAVTSSRPLCLRHKSKERYALLQGRKMSVVPSSQEAKEGYALLWLPGLRLHPNKLCILNDFEIYLWAAFQKNSKYNLSHHIKVHSTTYNQSVLCSLSRILTNIKIQNM